MLSSRKYYSGRRRYRDLKRTESSVPQLIWNDRNSQFALWRQWSNDRICNHNADAELGFIQSHGGTILNDVTQKLESMEFFEEKSGKSALFSKADFPEI